MGAGAKDELHIVEAEAMNYEGSPIKVTLATLKMSVQPTVRALTLGIGRQGLVLLHWRRCHLGHPREIGGFGLVLGVAAAASAAVTVNSQTVVAAACVV